MTFEVQVWMNHHFRAEFWSMPWGNW
jgi:hypothetical protein